MDTASSSNYSPRTITLTCSPLTTLNHHLLSYTCCCSIPPQPLPQHHHTYLLLNPSSAHSQTSSHIFAAQSLHTPSPMSLHIPAAAQWNSPKPHQRLCRAFLSESWTHALSYQSPSPQTASHLGRRSSWGAWLSPVQRGQGNTARQECIHRSDSRTLMHLQVRTIIILQVRTIIH